MSATATAAREGSTAVGSLEYANRLRATLYSLLQNVLRRRAPHVLHWMAAAQPCPIPSDESATPYLQTLSIWFQLQRIIDENASVRQRRQTESQTGTERVEGSFAAAFAQLDVTPLQARDAIDRLAIGPTLTAHPTEAKRVTVLEQHRRLYRGLVSLETTRWTPDEADALLDAIESDIDLLWLTGELRLTRPSLHDEIEWGLQFFRDSLFDAVPQVLDRVERVCADLPGSADAPTPQIRFHSWIGGDRDGNPNVTTQATAHALQRGRDTAIGHYRDALQRAASRLSINEVICPLPDQHRAALDVIINRGTAAKRNPNELFRQALSSIVQCLDDGHYEHIGQFQSDLATLESALHAIDASLLARLYIRPLRQRTAAFGFRTVTLDIRQNTTVTTAALADIWQQLGGSFAQYGEPAWSTRVRDELAHTELPDVDRAQLSDQSREVFSLLRLMHRTTEGVDAEAIGPFILSMTRSADDVLGVYLLARYAGFGAETLDLRVVPLFETIADLRNAPSILRDTLAVPLARRSLTRRGKTIEVMLGYSDSGKDGGFLCSVWELDRCQRRTAAALAALGIEVSFFHGRGGSVSRGGAPADRAIAAQPAGTLGNQLRITEQGEVVSARYANRGTAATHLELLLASSFRHGTSTRTGVARPELNEAMDALSALSQTAYVELINLPGFITYFQQASPVDELARLKIGSRPARRFGGGGLDDLRAIPWVFAWTQNRHLITGWYGFGSAVSAFCHVRGEAGHGLLQSLCRHSPLFRLTLDETEKSLYQSDLCIAADYASLVTDDAIRNRIFSAIEREHARTLEAVNSLRASLSTADRFPDFCTHFERKRTELEQIHALQVSLLRSTREAPTNTGLTIPLLQSMNAISAGLGWTG